MNSTKTAGESGEGATISYAIMRAYCCGWRLSRFDKSTEVAAAAVVASLTSELQHVVQPLHCQLCLCSILLRNVILSQCSHLVLPGAAANAARASSKTRAYMPGCMHAAQYLVLLSYY